MARLMWFAVHDQLEDLEEGREVSSLVPSLQPMKTSFPQGNRNCYNVQPPQGKGFEYLIITRFVNEVEPITI
ncbi:AT4g00280 [Arabidopsis thaliana]|uniref:AT4g00280 protein n=2 Tax=Arabidopsis TaxID=3701 RepID=O23074_ARATH|nr:ER protein carbohydrate-binding protein [Arabidopsis thaliana]KAG7619106.1 hypothetical protein ISN44_As04g000390 [Arabidopsis suecica]AAB62844.1 similar to A. thaliana light repressible receptor protein kinase (PID:E242366) [Arabidopsis thaliana]AAF02802.1 similar to A. thaliana light repressible receptor protein kinase (PID:E242366) [Arabidopsis thaliana]AEE81849.1 ER protein carbohydrate-binding protein [Arabidopsis thaliana]CAB80786.1 AT4g00280 [Arabidopsis thaliana]|eukprot:NP_567164.1 ER protein carbohydrate-binding protein [Arabidopsis thaliana]